MATSLFNLPDELVFTALSQSFQCRDAQIRALATLLYPNAAPCRNVVVHGAQSTGKSVVTEALLERMVEDGAELSYAVVNSVECITGRHLLETTINKVAESLHREDVARRCENLSQFSVELARMITSYARETERPASWRFVLVFDAIDRQRDSPPTLLPALARLSEIIPNLTIVFIMTCPPAGTFRTSAIPHVHFPNYSRNEFIEIISASSPPPIPGLATDAALDLWSRFVGPVYDSLGKAAARTLPALRQACITLWPRFTAPILAGTHGPRELTRLLVAARTYLQDERLLAPGIITAQAPSAIRSTAATDPQQTTELSALLPTTARLLLVAAYMASHNATKHDLVLFSTHYHGRRRRRGGLSGGTGGRPNKHRKIARRLLGAHAFVFERMLSIYIALRKEWEADWDRETGRAISGATLAGDVAMAVATLSSLRLLVRVGGGGDPTDRSGRWRVNVGWDVIRPLGRSMGVEVEDWLID
ncbi:hypothetical protein MGG_03184 [Pyricularia oryzae 70-15]|uniref:Uncharacterized protein n=1 Tax=Pyricularia oryzae (strain 70-15 / ATCC MYA-4617 / FGSC 8958) TaxID=242507 RepID=G4NAE1_PYRO7|nr:uncharacterized protein MGG_03184 [Pyricularia oryzae 70-15]EHA50486.1 hypothetical protein MGG_03184 [Pyricularia oryzae 70-15]KAI7931489.1 hypothetical protein M9X92_000320 [Pyricularia oryzae]KAI7931644.1 hypothetical protein M0657_001142 [Pyricularia oryzae]